MKYTVEIDIALPRDDVIELFNSVENLYKWQRGLQSFEHLSGESGENGATSRMVFLMGNRRIEMTETIIRNRLPDEFTASYDLTGVHNIVENHFIAAGRRSTKWVSNCVYEFKGYMRLITVLLRNVFQKQSLKFMQDFKAFAEHGTDVRDSPE